MTLQHVTSMTVETLQPQIPQALGQVLVSRSTLQLFLESCRLADVPRQTSWQYRSVVPSRATRLQYGSTVILSTNVVAGLQQSFYRDQDCPFCEAAKEFG